MRIFESLQKVLGLRHPEVERWVREGRLELVQLEGMFSDVEEDLEGLGLRTVVGIHRVR
jgi:hypothetical protein